MYKIIRVIIFAIFLAIFLYIKRRKILSAKFKFVYLGLCIGLLYLISAYPIENAFYTFKTPEAAYKYLYSETELKKLEGGNSTLLIPTGEKENCPRDILPKTHDGWKLSTIKESWPILDEFFGQTLVKIEKCNGDYYVFISGENIGTVSDNKSSSFQYEKIPILKGTVDVFTYAYVEDITDYALIIDGKTIQIT